VQKQKYTEIWNKNNGNILQSWQWGEIKSPQWTPKYLNVNDNHILILIRKLPLVNIYFGYIPRLDVVQMSLSEFLPKLLQAISTFNLTHLIIDPNIINNDINREVFNKIGFINNGKSIQPNQTNIVNLIKSSDDLWHNLDSKYRRNYNKSIKSNIKLTIFDNGTEALDRYYEIMKSIFENTKYIMHGKSYFAKVWSTLSVDKMANILIASINNVDVGAYLIAYDKVGAYELYGGVNSMGRVVEAGYFLKWEAIKHAQSIGKLFYDHWGVSPIIADEYDKNDELYNISKFKKGFGGENVVYLPQQVYVYNSFYYKLYKSIEVINKIALYLRKVIK
jgi:peptidoglycan pentaglycine glycine transferase (the first glycine)